jgi:hypothetical protein
MTVFCGIPAPRHDWTILGLHDMVEITITRRAAGSYSSTSGEYTEAASSTSTTEAIVYPAGGEDLKRLPEARRTEETLVVFAADLLRTARAGDAGHQADVLSGLPSPWDANSWEIVNVRSWPGAAFGYEALAQRMGQ